MFEPNYYRMRNWANSANCDYRHYHISDFPFVRCPQNSQTLDLLLISMKSEYCLHNFTPSFSLLNCINVILRLIHTQLTELCHHLILKWFQLRDIWCETIHLNHSYMIFHCTSGTSPFHSGILCIILFRRV